MYNVASCVRILLVLLPNLLYTHKVQNRLKYTQFIFKRVFEMFNKLIFKNAIFTVCVHHTAVFDQILNQLSMHWSSCAAASLF